MVKRTYDGPSRTSYKRRFPTNYRRRSYTRAATGNSRALQGRAPSWIASPRSPPSHHFFLRNLQKFQTGNIAVWYKGFGFKLDDIASYGELASLYDRYKIKWIDVDYIPSYNSNIYSGDNNMTCNLVVTPDFDDRNDQDAAALIQFSTARVFSPLKQWKMRLFPRIKNEVNAAAGSGYSVPGEQWIDMGSTQVMHYGLKMAMDDVPTYDICIKLVFTYHIECQASR